MKKNLLKKLFFSIVAIVLIIGTVVTTNLYAASKFTIIINKKSNDNVSHRYEAYQIFAGDLYVEDSNNKTLSNIKWGNGVKEEGLLDALKDDETIGSKFSDCTTAKEVAVVLENFAKDETDIKAFAQVISDFLNKSNAKTSTSTAENYSIEVDDPGYYFIKDEDDSLTSFDSAYTRYILEVVGDITIDPKSAKPTVKKSLSETSIDEKVDDYQINEKFNFYLTANLPESKEYGEYKTYKLVFEDTMDTGITYDKIVSIKVKAKSLDASGSDTEKEIELKANDDYNIEEPVEQTLKITITDLAKILATNNADITKGVDVVVTYTAHLNENANISKQTLGSEGNKPNVNTVKLQYSNNPNTKKEKSMGVTVEDTAYVFTYGVDNTKYANSKSPENILPGAEFKLYDSTKENEIKLKWIEELSAYCPIEDTEEELATVMKSQELTGQFNIVGLKAGTYILEEVKTPDGYNTCDDFEIKIIPTFNDFENSKTVTFSAESSMNNAIINVHGSKLPSTGSITLIIICGTAIVLGVTGLILSRNKKEE